MGLGGTLEEAQRRKRIGGLLVLFPNTVSVRGQRLIVRREEPLGRVVRKRKRPRLVPKARLPPRSPSTSESSACRAPAWPEIVAMLYGGGGGGGGGVRALGPPARSSPCPLPATWARHQLLPCLGIVHFKKKTQISIISEIEAKNRDLHCNGCQGSGRTRQRYSDGDGDGDPAAREDPRRERATYQSLRPCCVRERRDETRRDMGKGTEGESCCYRCVDRRRREKKKLDAVVVTSQEHDTDHLILTSHSHLLRVCCFPCYCLGGICEVLCDALTLVFCCPCRVCCGCPELSADRR